MSENISEETEKMVNQAKELVRAIYENKELFEQIKEIDDDIERLRLISRELEVFNYIVKNKKLTLEEIADELGSIRYTARLEIVIDRKDIELYAPSGTLLLRLPIEEAKNLTVDQLVVKPFQDGKMFDHLHERFIETLNVVTRELMGKFDLVEKINSIRNWIAENDP